MMTKNYRVGIIGFGMIGKVHAFGYASLPFFSQPLSSTFEITHVATNHRETAEAAAKICRASHAVTDFRAVTENPDIDIVHICTPNDAHLAPLVSAIQNGKHIYCDKPLTVSRDEAQTVAALLDQIPDRDQYGGISQMTFHLRFLPAIQRAKQILTAGQLGKIYQFRFHYLHASNADPNAPFKWKHDTHGGVIRDLASHILDLGDFLLGSPQSILADAQLAVEKRPKTRQKTLSTASETEFLPVQSEDAVTILARMESGAQGIFEATKLATGNEDELRVEIHGEQGALRFSLMNPHFLEYFDARVSDQPLGGQAGWTHIACGSRFEPPATTFPSPKSPAGWLRAHVACLQNFLHAVDCNQPTVPDLRRGIKIDGWLDLVRQSAQKREWINLSSEIHSEE